MTARGPSESYDPTSSRDENMEAERFLSRADVRQSVTEQQRSEQPTSSANQQFSSSQPSFRQATPRWVAPQPSSFDIMIDRIVVMLAEEGIRATHEQVRDMVRRLEQRIVSLAEEEDTAERNEGRQPRWFQ